MHELVSFNLIVVHLTENLCRCSSATDTDTDTDIELYEETDKDTERNRKHSERNMASHIPAISAASAFIGAMYTILKARRSKTPP